MHKVPLLTLTLSSPSFLDAEVKEDLSRNPIYFIKTIGTATVVTRSDPWEGSSKTADIKWPTAAPSKGKSKDIEGVLVQMKGGRLESGTSLLKPGSLLSSPRKFNIPGYSRPLKWKQVGNLYWCVCSSVKGPIAILEPAVGTVPPRLKIFETLHDKYDTRPLLVHRNVSILLMDYLLVTALLLVTDVQEWMVVKKYEGDTGPVVTLSPDNIAESLTPRSAPPNSTSPSQWRKILYGEPIFPKRASSSLSAPTEMPPGTPTSAGQLAKIMYGEPLYPTLRTPSPDMSLSDTDDDLETDDEMPTFMDYTSSSPRVADDESHYPDADHTGPVLQISRPASPSAESIYYPLAPASAPSHTYLDPSFYNEKGPPPVPPLPARYAASSSSRGASPSSASTARRRLPRPPEASSPVPSEMQRPQSTPPREVPFDRYPSSSSVTDLSSSVPSSIHHHSMGRTQSMSRRLPTPPTPLATSPPTLRHSQSVHKTLNAVFREKRGSNYFPRSLPPTPTSRSPEQSIHSDHRRPGRKPSSAHSEWFGAGESSSEHSPAARQSAFDLPPPAYNTINFTAGLAGLPPVPQLPTLPSPSNPDT